MFISTSIKSTLVLAALASPVSAATTAVTSLLPTEDLIGEELITEANANAFADRIFAESARLLSSSSWLPIPTFSDYTNEFKAVSGVFSAAGVYVTRAKATVDVPAQKLFDYLTTAQGYQLIDPYSTPEDFAKAPLQEFSTDKWRVGSGGSKAVKRLEAARTTSSAIPLIREREFVVLNAIDGGTRTFVSKSIQHASDPGCSKYGGASCFNASAVPVRALNSFAVQVDPVPTNASQSVVQLMSYADFTAEVPAIGQNVINIVFLPQVIGRMRTAFP